MSRLKNRCSILLIYITSTPVKHFDIALSGTYTGSMLVQHIAGSGTPIDVAVKTPHILRFQYKTGLRFCHIAKYDVNGGMQNLFTSYQRDFDTGTERDSGYIYGSSLIWSVFGGIKLKF